MSWYYFICIFVFLTCVQEAFFCWNDMEKRPTALVAGSVALLALASMIKAFVE